MPRHPGSGHGPFGRNILWFFSEASDHFLSSQSKNRSQCHLLLRLFAPASENLAVRLPRVW